MHRRNNSCPNPDKYTEVYFNVFNIQIPGSWGYKIMNWCSRSQLDLQDSQSHSNMPAFPMHSPCFSSEHLWHRTIITQSLAYSGLFLPPYLSQNLPRSNLFDPKKIQNVDLPKNVTFCNPCLEVKPHFIFFWITKVMIFSKNTIFTGGLTLVRVYSSQGAKHPHYPVKVSHSFHPRNES